VSVKGEVFGQAVSVTANIAQRIVDELRHTSIVNPVVSEAARQQGEQKLCHHDRTVKQAAMAGLDCNGVSPHQVASSDIELAVGKRLLRLFTGTFLELLSVDDLSAVSDDAVFESCFPRAPLGQAAMLSRPKQRRSSGVGQCRQGDRAAVQPKQCVLALTFSPVFLEKHGLNELVRQSKPTQISNGDLFIELTSNINQLNGCYFRFEFDSDEVTDTLRLAHTGKCYWAIRAPIRKPSRKPIDTPDWRGHGLPQSRSRLRSEYRPGVKLDTDGRSQPTRISRRTLWFWLSRFLRSIHS
jgi:hypothetical protein